jgi:hypothetical protein
MKFRAVLMPTTAALALTVAACAPRSAGVPWPPPDYTEFVILQGDSVVATERTARTMDRLEGEISMPGQATARYVATLTGVGTVDRVEVTTEAWSGPGRETVSVQLYGDSLVVASSRWNGLPQTFRTAAAGVYLHPSPALLELLLRRAMLEDVPGTAIPIWLVNQNAPATARVSTENGVTWLELAGTRIRLVHENGHVVMGEVPALGWQFHRR